MNTVVIEGQEVELHGRLRAIDLYRLNLLFAGWYLFYESKKGLLKLEIIALNPDRTVDVKHIESGKQARFKITDLHSYASLYKGNSIEQLYYCQSIVRDECQVQDWSAIERELQSKALRYSRQESELHML